MSFTAEDYKLAGVSPPSPFTPEDYRLAGLEPPQRKESQPWLMRLFDKEKLLEAGKQTLMAPVRAFGWLGEHIIEPWDIARAKIIGYEPKPGEDSIGLYKRIYEDLAHSKFAPLPSSKIIWKDEKPAEIPRPIGKVERAIGGLGLQIVSDPISWISPTTIVKSGVAPGLKGLGMAAKPVIPIARKLPVARSALAAAEKAAPRAKEVLRTMETGLRGTPTARQARAADYLAKEAADIERSAIAEAGVRTLQGGRQQTKQIAKAKAGTGLGARFRQATAEREIDEFVGVYVDAMKDAKIQAYQNARETAFSALESEAKSLGLIRSKTKLTPDMLPQLAARASRRAGKATRSEQEGLLRGFTDEALQVMEEKPNAILYKAEVKAEPAARQAARLAGESVLSDAAEAGFDPKQIQALAEHYTDFDDTLRRLAIERGIFTADLDRKWAGVHLRRLYEFFDGDEAAFLQALKETDPEDWARYLTKLERRAFKGEGAEGALAAAVRKRAKNLTPEQRRYLMEMKGGFRRAERGWAFMERGIRSARYQQELLPIASLEMRTGYVPIERAPRFLPLFRAAEKHFRVKQLPILYLPREVANPLLGIGTLRSWARALRVFPGWGWFLSRWKIARTAFSTPTQGHNLIGGMVQENIPGRVPAALIPVARTTAFLDLMRNGPLTQEYRSLSAGLKGTYANVELTRRVKYARPGYIGEAIWERFWNGVFYPIHIYSMIDEWTRASIFAANKWMGRTPVEAAKLADAAAIRYDRLGPVAELLAAGPLPFGRFVAGSIKPFSKATIERTGTIINWFRAAKATAYYDIPKEAVEAERLLLPEWARSYSVRLPWKDKYGRSQWFSFRYTFPLLGEETAEFWAGLGGPAQALFSLSSGKDSFTGREIWERDDPPIIKALKGAVHLGRTLLPRSPQKLPGWAKRAQPLLESAAKKIKEGKPLSLDERWALERAPSYTQAILRTYGVSLYTISPKLAYQRELQRLKRQLNEQRRDILRFERSARPALSPLAKRWQLAFKRHKLAQTEEEFEKIREIPQILNFYGD